MIRSFADRETERLFKGKYSRRLPADTQKRAKMRLDRIAAATNLGDLHVPPSHHLEQLSGDREGQHSIRINKQWRLRFKWQGGHAYEVEITDYH